MHCAEELQTSSQKRYEASLELKPMHKAQLRTWHRLKGALHHLRKLDAAKLVTQAKAKKHKEEQHRKSGKSSESLQTAIQYDRVCPCSAAARPHRAIGGGSVPRVCLRFLTRLSIS